MAMQLNANGATQSDIQSWCQDFLGALFGESPESINPDTDFDSLGLDSAMAVSMLLELEEQIEREVSPELFFEYTTIRELSEHVSNVVMKTKAAAA